MNTDGNPAKPRRKRKRRRRLFFHLTAMVVVLSPLLLAELVLRLCVAPPPFRADDPYVAFSDLPPLFAPDATGDRFETAAERLVAFRPQSFAASKPRGTFRVFCLGGSTVQGRPYSVETSFTTWLQLNLQAAQPTTNWEIVNCGGISYASYRLVPIMAEILNHEPDLFIVCTGHNEFLEDRTYAQAKRTPRLAIQLHRALLHLRSYALADRWLADRRNAGSSSRTVLTPEVRTKLDWREGLEAYRRDPARRQSTIEHLRHNLETMVRMARHAEVPIILVNPVANLKDCPPFKSEFNAELTESAQQQVIELREKARELGWSDIYRKIELLEQAAMIDDQHADLLYLIGMCYQRTGRSTEAKQWFIRAKEHDVCPLRIVEPMHEAILEIAARYQVPLLDARRLIEQQTEDGIPGQEWLLDHVHPTIAGHQLIADGLYRIMVEMDIIETRPDWLATRDERRRRHLETLNDAYYAQGEARLRRLQEWSRGRIPGAAPEATEAPD